MSCVVNYHYLDTNPDFSYHDHRRKAHQAAYAEYLGTEPAIGGRVLDIGCGHGPNPTYETIRPLLGELDGVDPFPAMVPPQHLARRWDCKLEDLPVPPGTYDMAYSYYVVEHVEHPGSYLTKIMEILKPGGVYWSMAPNSAHPFTAATRIAQTLRIKQFYKRCVCSYINDYPAYYRITSDKAVLKCIKDLNLPVAKVDFYYYPCVFWDEYFPASLRFIPNGIDKLYLLKALKRSFIFMFRIEKAE